MTECKESEPLYSADELESHAAALEATAAELRLQARVQRLCTKYAAALGNGELVKVEDKP